MKLSKINNSRGFTLIEILIVSSLTVFLSLNLINNFVKSRLNIPEVMRIVVSDIRMAQANAISSKQYDGEHRCGYGIFQSSSSAYFIYASNPTNPTNPGACNGNWKYNASQDTPVVFSRILDPRLEIFDPNGSPRPNFEDITFEPYNGQIRIDNQHQPNNQNQNRSQIGIRKIGATCPSVNCAYVCVYSFGRISVRSTECPACNNPATCPW